MIWERLLSWSKTVTVADVSEEALRWANADNESIHALLEAGDWQAAFALAFEAGRMWERTSKGAGGTDANQTRLVKATKAVWDDAKGTDDPGIYAVKASLMRDLDWALGATISVAAPAAAGLAPSSTEDKVRAVRQLGGRLPKVYDRKDGDGMWQIAENIDPLKYSALGPWRETREEATEDVMSAADAANASSNWRKEVAFTSGAAVAFGLMCMSAAIGEIDCIKQCPCASCGVLVPMLFDEDPPHACGLPIGEYLRTRALRGEVQK